MPSSIVTQRFVACYELLRKQRKIKSARKFALTLDYLPQSFSEVLHGKRDATIDVIRKAADLYKFNPMYIFTGEGEMFLLEEDTEKADIRILTVVTDGDNNERIVHVPVPAQAGYATELAEPTFVEDLPSFSLPGQRYVRGTFRSFDVAGDSMEPTLFKGDQVIGNFVEPNHWKDELRGNEIYVFVTHERVLVKRCLNYLTKNSTVTLLSDNNFHAPIVLHEDEIREIWHIRTRITQHLDVPKDEIRDLRLLINEQMQMISDIKDKL
jgi:phage repressor protein C with HTH and peptisase S24 domain